MKVGAFSETVRLSSFTTPKKILKLILNYFCLLCYFAAHTYATLKQLFNVYPCIFTYLLFLIEFIKT